MKSIINKFVGIAINPKKIAVWANYLLNHKKIKRIEKSGKVFFEYKGELFPEELNIGNGISHIEEFAKKYCQGKGMDVGADKWPFPGAIPIQNEEYQNAYMLDKIENNSLDYVFSSHCLEHLYKWKKALKLWITKLKTGGIIFLYLPHVANKMWEAGGPWGGPGHFWVPTHEVVNEFLKKNGIEIVDFNPGKDEYWSFYIIGKKS